MTAPASRRRTLPPDLADELRAARTRAGWTLRQAAPRLGVSVPFLSRLERGLRAPSAAVAERLAGGLALAPPVADRLRAHAVPPKEYRHGRS